MRSASSLISLFIYVSSPRLEVVLEEQGQLFFPENLYGRQLPQSGCVYHASLIRWWANSSVKCFVLSSSSRSVFKIKG